MSTTVEELIASLRLLNPKATVRLFVDWEDDSATSDVKEPIKIENYGSHVCLGAPMGLMRGQLSVVEDS